MKAFTLQRCSDDSCLDLAVETFVDIFKSQGCVEVVTYPDYVAINIPHRNTEVDADGKVRRLGVRR